jgi:acetoin utilization protein AcuB
MVVHQIMTRNPEYIETRQPLREAVAKFKLLRIRHLPVVEGSDLIGMVSDRDIVAYTRGIDLLAPNEAEALLDRPIADFVSGDVVSVDEDTAIAEVIDHLIDQRIGAIPVVDAHSGRLSGIVSYIDVLKVVRPMVDTGE